MKNVIIRYWNREQAEELLKALEIAGVRWNSGDEATEWTGYPDEGYIRILDNKILWGDLEQFENRPSISYDIFMHTWPIAIVGFDDNEAEEAFEILKKEGYRLGGYTPTGGGFKLYGSKEVKWLNPWNIKKEAKKHNIKIITFDELDPYRVTIYRKGRKVIAEMGGRKAVAKCNPSDKFNFYEGAKIALERLTGLQKGDHVKVIDNGHSFTTLREDFFEDMDELRRYKFGVIPKEGETGTIKRIGDDGKLYIELDKIECDYDPKSIIVIGKYGVERV